MKRIFQMSLAVTLLWYPLAIFVLRPALSTRKAMP